MNTNLSIKKLSDPELDSNLKALVSKEREILSQILIYIAEVDRRKLYLNFAYPSLFDYLTKNVGYSNGSAQRRIDAARLYREIPEVADNLQRGKVNLMQISLLQKSVRQVYSETKNKVSVATKALLLDQLSDKTFSESQVLVSQALDIQLKEQAKTTHQKDGSVRFEVTLKKSQWEKINRLRELLSNSLPNGSWDEVLEYASDNVIAQKGLLLSKVNKESALQKNDLQAVTAIAELPRQDRQKNGLEIRNKSNNQNCSYVGQNQHVKNEISFGRNYISMAVKREVFNRDKCCQFQDKASGRKCNSTWQLNLDHIQPVWAGGSNDSKNLRVLCAKHNRQIYVNQSNVKTVN